MLMILFIISAILIISALGAVEWNVYRQRTAANPAQEPLARRRLRRRGLGLFLLLIELFMFIFYDAFHARVQSPWMSLAYLGICVFLALVLFWVVIVDVRVSLSEIFATQNGISSQQAARLEAEIRSILEKESIDQSKSAPRDSKRS